MEIKMKEAERRRAEPTARTMWEMTAAGEIRPTGRGRRTKTTHFPTVLEAKDVFWKKKSNFHRRLTM